MDTPTERSPTEGGPTERSLEPRLTSRSIRSFVVRNGRLTRAQQQAVKTLLPQYGIPYSETPINPSTLFGRDAPVWMEIGFGNGDALLAMATQNPDVNLIGVEIHTPGIGQALMGIKAAQLSNVRLIQHDAMDVLQNMLAPASLAKVLLFFPDPWRKKRHHKRRIVQQEFLNTVASRLQSEGVLHCATDWADYAKWMKHEFSVNPVFTNTAGSGSVAPRPDWRPLTRFEQRGHRLGHDVCDLIFKLEQTGS
ncbi:MAG: tRNA (guanosine(46)-N7)-methyltransferase TrmB [Granulosicoccaceae bacterium]